MQVLLGDGYYADQTSRQTAEILHRRGKVLESKLESLKAMMLDLQAEASFFESTASEAAVSSVFHNQIIIYAYETGHKRLFKAAVAPFFYVTGTGSL